MNNFLFKNKIDVVLIDWHGILSKRGFWCNQSKINRNLGIWCEFLFGGDLLKDWMRDKISFSQLCEMTAGKFGLFEEEIIGYFEKDLSEYGPKWEVCNMIDNLFPESKKVLFSENPLLFKEKILNNNRLAGYFDDIILSCDHGVLKEDRDPSLFDIALKQLNLDDFNNVVLIDDKSDNCAYFRELGGHIINIK